MSLVPWKGCFLILISVTLMILYIMPLTMLRVYRFSFPTILHSKSLSVSLIRTGIYPRSTKFSYFAYNDLSQPLLLTMADSYYSSAIENLHFKLRKYNLQRNFIVLCLDIPCLNLCHSKQILSWSGFLNVSVSNLKFQVTVDLLQAGFDFILFDTDVFFSSLHSPLLYMHNFSDPTWDAQFQLDENYDNGKVNVGWFWTRPTPQSIDYFVETKHIWFTQGGISDQNLMQSVMAEKESKPSSNSTQRSLVVLRLDLKKFLNYMGTEWIEIFSGRVRSEKNFFALDESFRFQLIHNASNEVVLWHYTCVDKSLKLFLPKYFGQWTNVNDYYTKSRKFLLPINIGYGGTDNMNVLLIQFLITIKLALITERTLIFPDTVVYKAIRNFPGIRTFSLKEIIPLNIDYVEPNYLYHRQAKHGITFTNGFNYSFSTESNLPLNQQLENLLRELQSSLKSKELIKLDFSTFQSINDLLEIKKFDEWWKNNLSLNDKRYVNLNQLRLCHNIDQQQIDCVRICL